MYVFHLEQFSSIPHIMLPEENGSKLFQMLAMKKYARESFNIKISIQLPVSNS